MYAVFAPARTLDSFEAAVRLNISLRALWLLVTSGKLAAAIVAPGVYRFAQLDVDLFYRARQEGK